MFSQLVEKKEELQVQEQQAREAQLWRSSFSKSLATEKHSGAETA